MSKLIYTLFMVLIFSQNLFANEDAVITVIKSTQEKVNVKHGEFDVKVSWLTIETIFDYSEPLNGVVKFTPQENLDCKNISFIQIAQVLDNDGNNYVWPLGEAPRNDMMTENGFFIDHSAWNCWEDKNKPCSPFYRDHWPNIEDGSQDGSSMSGEAPKQAILVDYPFGWEHISSIKLEACAICRETKKNYGCYRWGGVWPVVGERDFLIEGASETPSLEFSNAMKLFSNYYSR